MEHRPGKPSRSGSRVHLDTAAESTELAFPDEWRTTLPRYKAGESVEVDGRSIVLFRRATADD